jgi:integrase
MTDVSSTGANVQKPVPWNKGKIVGAKPPLRPRHVWSIRTKLQVDSRIRDLALFNIAIDSKLRGCDVLALKVDDVAPSGYAADRASVRQKKTGRPVKFELTESTRQAIDDYLRATGKKPDDRLFTGRRGPDCSLTTRRYARLLSDWLAGIRVRPSPVRNALTASNKGDAHLSAHWQLAGRAASAGEYQNREHRPPPRNRGR